MAPGPRLLAPLLALLLAAPLGAALIPPLHAPSTVPVGVPRQADPDVPAVTAPVVVTAFQDEHWAWTEGPRTRMVQVPANPAGAWDRIVMVYRQYPSTNPESQDPWDRLCSAAIAGVEVIRCTTPRTDFTLRKDVTELAALMPPGAMVPVTANTGTYAGDGQWVTVTLEFYAGEPTGLPGPLRAEKVVPAWYHRGLCANGNPLSATVTFPAEAPTLATADIHLSGHGGSEFFYLDRDLPVFHLFVDGREVGQVVVWPYIYAFLGFYGGDYTIHPWMWWTAQQAMDAGGVHLGVGEIPAYRVTLLPTDLGLLTGTRTVTLVGENGTCYWPSSVSFQLS